MTLAEEKCAPSQSGTPPLSRLEAKELAKEAPQWTLKDSEIEREFRFEDFRRAINFVNNVADVAEEEDHHPDIHIRYNKVRLVLSTHRMGGLSRNEFIMAAKIDRLTY